MNDDQSMTLSETVAASAIIAVAYVTAIVLVVLLFS